MFNQFHLIFFFPSFLDLLPHLIFAGVFFWIFVLITLIRYAKTRDGDARAQMEPLAVWHYSPAEWQKYAEMYDLAKFPQGAARVQITLLDVWIVDDGRVRRTILDEERKCVTACKFENQILKIRVRSWAIPTRFGSVAYSVQDVSLPVPEGHERVAGELAKLFSEHILRANKKVASVMPASALSRTGSEISF